MRKLLDSFVPIPATRQRAAPGVFVAILIVLFGPLLASAADVVIVRTSDAEPYAQAEAAFRQRIGDRQYNIKSLSAREASDQGIDASIGKPDVVVAVGTAAAKWLHKHLPPGVKLVYCMVSNPSEATLLQGQVCTGVTTDIPVANQLRLVAEALPRARSIGLLYRSDSPDGKAALIDLQASLPAGWHVEPIAVNDYPSIAAAIDALTQKQIDIIWTNADSKLYDTASVRALLLAAVRNKIPVWGYSLAFVRAGALLGVGVEPGAQGQQAADLVAKTIGDPAGFKSGAVSPHDFQIAVNLIVAEQIGVDVPGSLSRRASFVYQPEK